MDLDKHTTNSKLNISNANWTLRPAKLIFENISQSKLVNRGNQKLKPIHRLKCVSKQNLTTEAVETKFCH